MKKNNYKPNIIGLYGFIIIICGFCFYIVGVILGFLRRIFFLDSDVFMHFITYLVWYSGLPVILGSLIFLGSLLYSLPLRKKDTIVEYRHIKNQNVTVLLTAYNDELSIGEAVKDFIKSPYVKRVIVISNNSSDKTIEKAKEAGAIVYNEEMQGYGPCVIRSIKEGIRFNDTEYTVICEGDMTFRAYDMEKFLAYIPHGDIVVGTRIVEQLRDYDTQLSTFMFYGNFFVGKLLEIKHLGRCSLSDVGTTYKLCSNQALEKLLPHLNNKINLEFNPYFLDTALSLGINVVECPITFHKRVGVSKGGNINNLVAFRLGIKMIKGILFKWESK